jgi:hypothetical protein
VAAAGDFNGDGTSDILWRHDSGPVVLFEMQDGALVLARALGGFDTTWEIAGANDVTGDGTTDVIWRNEDTGFVATWEMQNGVVAVERGVGGFDNTWALI